ncbi:MAG: methyltransferase domain-containing protein [Deltaproteobacteria bacterium]|nr:methyltransferase domain-containing protein [Deltaproteobacteria bacterium]
MSPRLEPEDVEGFRALVERRFGLRFDATKDDDLAELLRRRMEASGASGFGAYQRLLSDDATQDDETAFLAEALTINETFFFRNADAFRALVEGVLPALIAAASPHRRLRILSAGCASGEEPYSLAMMLSEALPDLASWDVQIVAVDIDPAALAKAERARYSSWSLRATPEATRLRYFEEVGREFVVDPGIRQMVRFVRGNLTDDRAAFWRAASHDLVFCRNVLMYFAPEHMADVITRAHRALRPGGYLFLGHAESLRGMNRGFHLCHTHDTFYYQKRTGADAAAPGPRGTDSPPAALPPVGDSSTSWVDAIQRASERIAALAHQPTTASAPPPPSAGARSLAAGGVLAPALEAMRQERFGDALALLSGLAGETAADPDAMLMRAVLLTNSGRLDEARACCERLLALDEFNAGVHYVMALSCEHAGDVESALDHDQTAAYLDPGFAMPRLHMGLVARRAGDDTTARRELSHALALLAREDASRLLLFGGGFSRDTLSALCRAELRAAGGER